MTHPTPESPSPQERARQVVQAYVKSRLTANQLSTVTFEDRHVFLLSFGFVLLGWKAILATTLSKDVHYEVTYDNFRGQTILQVFSKVDEVRIAENERY